jgi:hypothetical protein
VQRALTTTTNLLPVALFDLLLVAAVSGVAVLVIARIRDARRARRVTPLLRGLTQLGTAAAATYLIFLVLWGFNYRRIPMTERLVLAPGAATDEAVVRLGTDAVSRLNELYDAAHARGWGGREWRDPQLREAFARIQRVLTDAPPAAPGRLKGTILGPYFRWTGVDGMVNPFGLEVLANPDLLAFERPFVAAHEWAHLAGFANEAEANFVGWLTCMGGDAALQYSGWLFLYWQVSGEIDERARARLSSALAAGPRRDVEAIVARMRRGQWPMMRRAGWAVYDQYLKANRVDEGIRSYGAVVTLILRARFDEEWTPVRASRASR